MQYSDELVFKLNAVESICAVDFYTVVDTSWSSVHNTPCSLHWVPDSEKSRINSTNGGKRNLTLNPEPSKMTSQRKKWRNVDGAKKSGARSKRQTKPMQKALKNAVELKWRQILRSCKRLLRDGPLEKLWGWGEFSSRRNFFCYQILCMNFF